ncbi:beta-glucuronidase [Maribellus comscasis]|uniref:Beta-glucuronidase n=1 Tax=Maribellus comscasis TaxID=2681766 RepID=A0A6I6K2E6_9BACT|nr:sugar-binding domain-containing protein [Maribellus comscasis]QGY47570.1 beta-glucuronidase [Maribellus comscasis]
MYKLVRALFVSFLWLIIFMIGLTAKSQNNIPRPEHPKPQFMRDSWINLNGQWNFAFDFGQSGIEKGWFSDPSEFDMKISVPFCPESSLSGIGHTDFVPAVWYHRQIDIPESWRDKRVILHFGAVDYDCRAWINGTPVGRHYGGSVSFSFDITEALQEGVNDLVVCALDDIRSGIQPGGKQSIAYDPAKAGMLTRYTRTTGIWQTVWLEARPESYIESVNIVPDLDNSCFTITPVIENYRNGMDFNVVLLSDEGEEIVSKKQYATQNSPVILELANPEVWCPDNPYLYGLQFELLDGNKEVDVVKSYAGLRKFHIEGNKFFLNNEPIFLRFVLDQGYYPDGILTAPTDQALKKDIVLALEAGFNGARLHDKIFEERFHYWADKLGYLTWGEYIDYGESFDWSKTQVFLNQQREWRESIMRDRNHPSIVAWTPFNETIRGARYNLETHRRAIIETYDLTRNLDPTRPINDASGYVHVKTDIFSIHDYDQNVESWKDKYQSINPNNQEKAFIRYPEISIPYNGEPYVVDEYGGTFWTRDYANKEQQGDSRTQWGYGKTEKQVKDLIKALTSVLLNNPNIAGYCFTQLYDVEAEVNGIYSYQREPKFNIEQIKEIFAAPAAIEE